MWVVSFTQAVFVSPQVMLLLLLTFPGYQDEHLKIK